MFKRFHLIICSCYALSAFLLPACKATTEQAAKVTGDRVSVAVVRQQSAAATITLPGEVESPFTTELGFTVPGRIQHLYVDEGALVKRGQRLAELEQSVSAATKAIAVKATDATKDRFAASRQLDSTGSIARAKYLEDFHQLESALASEKLATVQQEQCNLLAPADGIIIARYVDIGSLVQPGARAFMFLKKAAPKIVCMVPSGLRRQLKEGMVCEIIAAGDSTRLAGKIAFINPVPDPIDKQFRIKIHMDIPQTALPPATAVSVSFPGQFTSGLTVSQAAVRIDDSGRPFVFAIRKNTCKKTFIEVKGGSGQKDALIIQGLAAGDSVVVAGADNLDNKPIIPILNPY